MQTNVRTPSYRHHKPSGQAVATISGRDFYLGKFDSPESHEAYGRTIAAWKAGTLVHPSARAATAAPMSIASLIAKFWLHVEADGLYAKDGKHTSERSCIAVALRPLMRLFGSKPAATFGPLDLQTVRRELCRPLPPPKEGEKRRRVHTGPIARASVNKHVHRIRRLFQWATSMQLVPATTWHALQSVPALRRGQCSEVRDPDRIRPAPLRAVAAVLRRVPAPVAAMIRLQWLTGMRPGEVVQLRLGDIERSSATWIYRPGSHKNQHRDHVREVDLGPRAQKVLAPLLQLNPAAYLFAGKPKMVDGVRIVPHLREDSYAKTIARACSEAKAEHWTPHQLRHNLATRARSAVGLDVASTILGHSTPNTTLIYAEKDRSKARVFVQKHG